MPQKKGSTARKPKAKKPNGIKIRQVRVIQLDPDTFVELLDDAASYGGGKVLSNEIEIIQ
jgi:hypothetical protein